MGAVSNARETAAARHFGIDGCRGGWFHVCLADDELSGGIAPNISDLLAETSAVDNVFIDIPIGLLESGAAGRRCDAEARHLLGPRASSVFNAPIRGVLGQHSYALANLLSRELSGKGLSKQTWNICGKIREVDSLLRTDAKARKIFREAHPELCFFGLAGGRPMQHNKKTGAGFAERMAILEHYLPAAGDFVAAALARYLRSRVARDDIVDATACALAASMREHWCRLPADAERDAEGLAMAIVYCRP